MSHGSSHECQACKSGSFDCKLKYWVLSCRSLWNPFHLRVSAVLVWYVVIPWRSLWQKVLACAMKATATVATVQTSKNVVQKLCEIVARTKESLAYIDWDEFKKEISSAPSVLEMLRSAPASLDGASGARDELAEALKNFEDWIETSLNPDYMENLRSLQKWLEEQTLKCRAEGIESAAKSDLPEPAYSEELSARFFLRCSLAFLIWNLDLDCCRSKTYAYHVSNFLICR